MALVVAVVKCGQGLRSPSVRVSTLILDRVESEVRGAHTAGTRVEFLAVVQTRL